MELAMQNGDYVPDGVGGLRRVSGREALLQRVLFKLAARRGAFPFREDLGSRLWQLPKLPAAQRQGAAAQFVAEALEGEDLCGVCGAVAIGGGIRCFDGGTPLAGGTVVRVPGHPVRGENL